MTFQTATKSVHLQIKDLARFTRAVAAQLSYAACIVSGYSISGAHELPFFEIEVEEESIMAYISGVGQNGGDIDCVIVYFFDQNEEDTVIYAVAYPHQSNGEWTTGPCTVVEKIDPMDSFSNLPFAQQVTLLEGR